MRGVAVATALAFLLGTSLHLGLHGHCAGHDPGGGAPEENDAGCLACQVLVGGLVEVAAPLLPAPSPEFVPLVLLPERPTRALWLPCVFARGPPV